MVACAVDSPAQRWSGAARSHHDIIHDDDYFGLFGARMSVLDSRFVLVVAMLMETSNLVLMEMYSRVI